MPVIVHKTTEDIPPRFLCPGNEGKCKQELPFPRQLWEEWRQGEAVTLHCPKCGGLAEVEQTWINEFYPNGESLIAVGWTATFYGFNPS